MKKVLTGIAIALLTNSAVGTSFAGDNTVQWNGTFHGKNGETAENTTVFVEGYKFLDSDDGGVIYDDETIYFATSAYQYDLTSANARLWKGAEVWVPLYWVKNQSWNGWMGSSGDATYDIWRGSIAAGTGGLDYVGSVSYYIQHVDGSDNDYLKWSGGTANNNGQNMVDTSGEGTDYSFTIVDDDNTGPTANNHSFSGTKFHVDLTDGSGIYDPGSTLDSPYMIYDDDGDLDNGVDGTNYLTHHSLNNYAADTDINYGSLTGKTVSIRVFAYDNDNDRTSDRAQSTNDFSYTWASAAPLNVQASDAEYAGYVRVSWDAADGATSYKVYHSTENNSATATLAGSTAGTSFDDGGVSAGVTYYFWVKSSNAGGDSDFSSSDTGSSTASGSWITIH